MTKIYCKPTDKGVHTFYLFTQGKTYSLFSQKFSTSNREFFGCGLAVNQVFSFENVHSFTTRKTLEKLQSALFRAEREWGLSVTNKTNAKQNRAKKHVERAVKSRCDFEDIALQA